MNWQVLHIQLAIHNHYLRQVSVAVIFLVLCLLHEHHSGQWRSKPDNLVPLWKFQTSLFISLEIDCFLQSMNTKNLHSGTKSSGWLRH